MTAITDACGPIWLVPITAAFTFVYALRLTLAKKVTGILKQSDWIKDSNGPGGSTPAKYFFGIKVQTTCKALFWIRTISRLFSDVRTRAESKPTTRWDLLGPHNRKAN